MLHTDDFYPDLRPSRDHGEAHHEASSHTTRVGVRKPAGADQTYRAIVMPDGSHISFREIIAFEGESALYSPISAEIRSGHVVLERLPLRETCAIYRDYYLGRPLPGPLYTLSTLSVLGHRTPSTIWHGLFAHPVGFMVGCIVLMAVHQFNLIDFTHATSIGFALTHALLPILVSAFTPRSLRAAEALLALIYKAARRLPITSSTPEPTNDGTQRVAEEAG